MFRNLSGRVEVATPVTARHPRERLWEILEIARADRRQAWELHADGSYHRVRRRRVRRPGNARGAHQTLMDLARGQRPPVG